MSVVDLAAWREEHLPHVVGPVECALCEHRWVAVMPVALPPYMTRAAAIDAALDARVECPRCGLMEGRFQ